MSGEGEEGMMAKNKVKFLCSHSGKILPRPPDGQLKYVGGETRVVAVPRAIDFSGLMEKLSGLCEGDMVLKYQLIPDEFDILVSVTSNEDLQHMIAEYDRQESTNTNATESSPPRLRTFLFPSHPVVLERQQSSTSSSSDSTEAEQRYIDAINGILRCSTNAKRSSSLNTGSRSIFSVSSACSSPTDHYNDTNVINNNHDAFAFGNHNCGSTSTRAGFGFQRVCSSPSLYNLSQLSQQTHHVAAPPLHQQQQLHHHQQHHNLPQHQYSHQPSFSRLQRSSSANGPGRLVSQLSIGGSSSNLPPPVHYYHPSSLKHQQQQLKGCSGCSSCGGPADGSSMPGYQ